jgi:hypothetical protein
MLSLVLSAAAIAGCGTYVGVTEINPAPVAMTARSSRSVEVYASGPPARPHTDVAIIEAEQTHSLNEQSTGLMIRRMREQAAAMGCDAIVLGGTTDHNGAQPGSGWDLLDPGSTKREATCIVYGEEEPARPFTRTLRPRAAAPEDAGTADRRSQVQDAEDPTDARPRHASEAVTR